MVVAMDLVVERSIGQMGSKVGNGTKRKEERDICWSLCGSSLSPLIKKKKFYCSCKKSYIFFFLKNTLIPNTQLSFLVFKECYRNMIPKIFFHEYSKYTILIQFLSQFFTLFWKPKLQHCYQITWFMRESN